MTIPYYCIMTERFRRLGRVFLTEALKLKKPTKFSYQLAQLSLIRLFAVPDWSE